MTRNDVPWQLCMVELGSDWRWHPVLDTQAALHPDSQEYTLLEWLGDGDYSDLGLCDMPIEGTHYHQGLTDRMASAWVPGTRVTFLARIWGGQTYEGEWEANVEIGAWHEQRPAGWLNPGERWRDLLAVEQDEPDAAPYTWRAPS